jgi:hypothetical protein
MSTKYKATVVGEAYFITITTVGWVDVFTRLKQRYILIDSLKYCQKERGLEIYAYCIAIYIYCVRVQKVKHWQVLLEILKSLLQKKLYKQ